MIPFLIPIIWVGSVPFFLLVLGLCLLSYWEYANMAELGGYPNQLYVGMAGTVLMVLALYLDGAVPWGPIHRGPSPLFVLMVWTFFSFIREFIRWDKGHSLLRIITSLTGVILCALFLGHLMLLRDLRLVAGDGMRPVGREIFFFLVLVIWSVDVGAWLIGRAWGRIKIAPLISPGKTLEGSLAGTLFGCLVGWLFQSIFMKNILSTQEGLFFAVIISLTAQFSDLVESLLKRSFGVKNSSELLPGHGGILDRFDSFLFSAPFFYYLLLATGRFQ